MITWVDLFNFSIGVAGFVLALLGLVVSIAWHPLERWSRSFFIATFAILVLYTFAVTVDSFAIMYHISSLLQPFIFIESLSSSLIMPLLTVYMLRLCRENPLKSPLFITIAGLLAVYILLLIFTQFTTAIYYIEDDGVYHRGPLYPLLLVPPILIMLLNLFGLIHRRRRLTGRQFHAQMIYIAVPLASMVIQMFLYGLLLIVCGTIIGALTMFVFILSEQIDIVVLQARENAEKEFELRVLQMRPHFIYNIMTSIYYLVDSDPGKAKETIRDFSKYLYRNFNAVAKTAQVPFEEELAHTQAYLAVEKARFGSRLEVTYDLPHTVFHLPPLTLEPLVENAVKHGMDPDCDPLRIIIRTRSLDGGSEITVEDNGTDIHSVESAVEGVGLSNVRNRLSVMCGGTLSLSQRENGGVTAVLWIPDT